MKNSNYVTKEFLEKLSEEVKNGYVTVHENPDKKIFNYTYSRLTEQENHWNEITLRTRGLILDSNGRIIFNCPRKFFNFQQNNFANDTYERLKDDFKIYEKLDGSAIWVVNDSEYGFVVSSKSSFTSEHAAWAKEIIEQKFKEKDSIFKEGICYCFELIHPENRIVVDYGEEKTLKLWGLKTQSGETIELEDSRIDTSYFETPKLLGTNNDKTAIDNYINQKNVEGVVLKGEGDDRIKIKSQTYLELHRIKTECTPNRILELLMSGKRVSDYDFPDEFLKEVQSYEDIYLKKYQQIYNQIESAEKIFHNLSDKEIGLAEIDGFLKSGIFNLRRNKDVSNLIWRKVKEENVL